MESITWQGAELRPVHHLYNLTSMNERCVELAVAAAFIAVTPGRLIEVGNVLGHYSACGHEVIDMCEPAAWYQTGQSVRGLDVVDVRGSWDALVSISTVEHIGVDTDAHDGPGRALRALEHMRRHMLAPAGRALVTWPCGVNPALDQLVTSGGHGADVWSVYYRGADGQWHEAVADVPVVVPGYASLDSWAAAVFIGEFGAL